MDHIVARTAAPVPRLVAFSYYMREEDVTVKWNPHIGEGGYSLVYVCTLEGEPDKRYAIKIPRIFDDALHVRRDTNLAQFLEEAPQLSQECYQEKTFRKEWLVNESLLLASAWLHQRGPLVEEQTLSQGFQIAYLSYQKGSTEHDLMKQHLGYASIIDIHYFFDGNKHTDQRKGRPPMLIMEGCEGILHSRLERDMKIEESGGEQKWKEMLRAVVAGCRYMAMVGGIRHRDMKTDNIFFSDDKWKISDFGLAYASDDRKADYALDVTMFAQQLFLSIDDLSKVPKTRVMEEVRNKNFLQPLYALAYYLPNASWREYFVTPWHKSMVEQLEMKLFTSREREEMQNVEELLANNEEREAYFDTLKEQAQYSPLKLDGQDEKESLCERGWPPLPEAVDIGERPAPASWIRPLSPQYPPPDNVSGGGKKRRM